MQTIWSVSAYQMDSVIRYTICESPNAPPKCFKSPEWDSSNLQASTLESLSLKMVGLQNQKSAKLNSKIEINSEKLKPLESTRRNAQNDRGASNYLLQYFKTLWNFKLKWTEMKRKLILEKRRLTQYRDIHIWTSFYEHLDRGTVTEVSAPTIRLHIALLFEDLNLADFDFH